MSELKVEEVVALILDVPKLLQRPIIDDGTIAKVCRPPEIAEEFL
jgi:arsenate reductase-like glutaredoxin family protein